MVGEGATPVLSVRGLTKDYPGMRALDSFELDLPAGEIHGIVGANGAGKSTLIKILSGLQAPTTGSIDVGGETVTIRSAKAAQRLGISVVHQELPLLPNLTSAQNVAVGREPGGLFSRAHQRRARHDYRDASQGFPGAPFASRKLESQGLYAWQVVAIIRAMAADARVLVLDEPTSSLTVDERNALHARVRELAAGGLAVLYVSHFLDDILDVASVVSVLRDGRLVHRGPTADLDEQTLLSHMTAGTAAAAASDATPRSPAMVSQRANGGEAAGLDLENFSTGSTSVPQLTVEPGEIVGLYGLEDSGARDVVEAIFGLRSRSGSVRWGGRPLSSNPRDTIKSGVTLVTGDRKRTGIPQWSVEMNHALPRLSTLSLLAWTPRRAIGRNARRSIADFNIKGSAHQKLGLLSGGNQQKLLLARWVETAPFMCLLLDEPTHGVDVAGRRGIYEQLRSFAQRGNAVLLHSTDPEEIVELCDRALPFASGRPLAELRRDELSIDLLEYAVRASTRHQTLTLEAMS